MDDGSRDEREQFLDGMGPRIREASIASFGPEAAGPIVARVFGHIVADWDRIRGLDDRARYLHEYARRRTRPFRRRRFPAVPRASASWIEPGLPRSLQALARRERLVVILRLGYGRSLAEIGELLGADPSTVQLHLDLGVGRLQVERGGPETLAARRIGDQVAAYTEQLDKRAPTVEQLRQGEVASLSGRWRRRVALAAVVVAAALLVLMAVLTGNRDDELVEPGAGPGVAVAAVDVLNRTAVTPATFSAVGHSYAGPGGVAVSAGQYHMLSSAYGNGHGAVTYLTSEDGVIWTQGAPGPVLDLTAVPWAPLAPEQAVASSLVIDTSGRWQLFFEIAWFDDVAGRTRRVIGRATADEAAGPWQFDEEPILRPDEQLPWAAAGVASPSVVASGDGLLMLFVGYGVDGHGSIGVAQSSGGAQWGVRPGPVMAALADWEGTGLGDVDLLAVGGEFVMFFGDERTRRRGYAESSDGLEWARFPANPIITAEKVAGASLYATEFVAAEEGFLALVENGDRERRGVAVLRVRLSSP